MAEDRPRAGTFRRALGSVLVLVLVLVLVVTLAGLSACGRSGEGEEDCDGSAAWPYRSPPVPRRHRSTSPSARAELLAGFG